MDHWHICDGLHCLRSATVARSHKLLIKCANATLAITCERTYTIKVLHQCRTAVHHHMVYLILRLYHFCRLPHPAKQQRFPRCPTWISSSISNEIFQNHTTQEALYSHMAHGCEAMKQSSVSAHGFVSSFLVPDSRELLQHEEYHRGADCFRVACCIK